MACCEAMISVMMPIGNRNICYRAKSRPLGEVLIVWYVERLRSVVGSELAFQERDGYATRQDLKSIATGGCKIVVDGMN